MNPETLLRLLNKQMSKEDLALLTARLLKDMFKKENIPGLLELLLLSCKLDPSLVDALKLAKKVLEVVINEMETSKGNETRDREGN